MSREIPTAWQNFMWNVEDFLHRNMGWIVAILLGALLLGGYKANAEGIAAKPIIQSLEDPTRYVEAWVEEEPVEQCFSPFAPTFVPEFWIENMLVTMYWYDTIEEFREDTGETDPEVHAMSLCETKPDKNIAYCDVFMVKPRRVDDDSTLSGGHEYFHGLFGAYHE